VDAPAVRRLPIGPLALVVLGGLLLLNNLGVLSWDVWTTVGRFWPLVLVLFGLQALVTGRLDWASLVGLLCIFGLISLGSHFVASRPGPAALGDSQHYLVQQPLAGAQRAVVKLAFGGGALQVSSGAAPGLLADAELSSGRAPGLSTDFQVQDGVGRLALRPMLEREAQLGFPFGGGEAEQLAVRLATGLPLSLDLEAGGGEATLDLRDLTVPSLRYSTGATRSRLVLPATGATQATIQAGAAALTIELPPGVAARIRTGGSGLSNLDVDQARFPATPSGYASTDFEQAANRVDLTLHAGLAQVIIR
jgi:hypothetical protein